MSADPVVSQDLNELAVTYDPSRPEGDRVSPEILTIPSDFVGTITFNIENAIFNNPPITFADNRTVQYVERDSNSLFFTITWANDNTTPEMPYSVYYTLHALQLQDGKWRLVKHDPAVQNQPPTGP